MLQFHDLSHLHELPKSQNTKQRCSISTLKAARRTKIIALHKRNRTTPSLTATSIGTQNELPLVRYSRTASSIRNLNVQRRTQNAFERRQSRGNRPERGREIREPADAREASHIARGEILEDGTDDFVGEDAEVAEGAGPPISEPEGRRLRRILH